MWKFQDNVGIQHYSILVRRIASTFLFISGVGFKDLWSLHNVLEHNSLHLTLHIRIYTSLEEYNTVYKTPINVNGSYKPAMSRETFQKYFVLLPISPLIVLHHMGKFPEPVTMAEPAKWDAQFCCELISCSAFLIPFTLCAENQFTETF